MPSVGDWTYRGKRAWIQRRAPATYTCMHVGIEGGRAGGRGHADQLGYAHMDPWRGRLSWPHRIGSSGALDGWGHVRGIGVASRVTTAHRRC